MKKKRDAPKTPASGRSQLKNNLRFIIRQHLQGRNFRPSSSLELLQRLAIVPEQHETFVDLLEEMQTEGILKKTAQNLWISATSQEKDYQEGVIGFHPRGFAFVRLENSTTGEDVFIPPGQALNALPFDRVCIEITGQDRRGPEGRVVHILERGKKGIYGTVLENSEGKTRVNVFIPALNGTSMTLELQKDETVILGDRVLMKVIEWENQESDLRCSLVEKLGHIDDASCDIDIGIREAGLRREFPPEALDEAMAFGKDVSADELANRRDLRKTVTVTIDPDTAKDYDDAISLEKIGDVYHLGVHIADVAHYVKHGSALDKEARERCNSTYFPGYCLPMLPAELSNELCSLKPHVDRLTVSVLMRFDAKAHLLDYEICRSVICSAQRLTYRGALAILNGQTENPHAPLIHLMSELCEQLKGQKAQRGSVEFSLPEVVVMCDAHGIPQSTDFITYDITHQMIEEFMVKANEVVAMHLSRLNRAMMYRVHEKPVLDDLRDFFQAARFFGHQFQGLPTPQDLHAFFHSIHDAPYINQLATAYIRSMRLAQYSTKNVGHYGLGLEYYCHFTSPIRRYSDLTVIRSLFEEPRDEGEHLEAIAQRACDCERASAKAEQGVLLLKKLRYLYNQHEKTADISWQGLVSRIKAFGISFEIGNLLFEGFIHISQLSDDYFIYDEPRQALRGRRSGLALRAGTVIELQLLDVDLIHRECRWSLHPAFLEQAIQEKARARENGEPEEVLPEIIFEEKDSSSAPRNARPEHSRRGASSRRSPKTGKKHGHRPSRGPKPHKKKHRGR